VIWGRALAKNWHISRTETSLTLSRRLPARFDLAIETRLKPGSKTRLAQQIRQDLWRALQDLRGFSPAVRVTAVGPEMVVTAGGQVDGIFPRGRIEAMIADVLENPKNRERWQRNA